MKSLTFFLGSRCNANCAYCHADKTKTEGSSEPSVLVYQYLTKQLQEQPCLAINFYGGEPTLYMKAIEKMVNHCAGHSVFYHITTNGLKLNDESLVSYFNDNNFYVTVSFDGVRGIRGYDDVFFRPEYYPNLNRLKHLGCSITLSGQNAELIKSAQELGSIENSLGRLLPFRPHYVHATTPAVGKMGFDKIQARQYAADYITLVEKFINLYKQGYFSLSLYPLFRLLYKSVQQNYAFPETRCFNKNHYQLDLDGMCYLCTYERSRGNLLGSIANEYELFNKLATIMESSRPECLTCNVYQYCGSHCLASVNQDIECDIHKRLLEGFLIKLDKENIDFSGIAQQDFAQQTGGYYELYR